MGPGVPRKVSGTGALPCDRDGVFDRGGQDRKFWPRASDGLPICGPADRTIRGRACFEHGQVVPVSAVPVRDRLFRRAAIHAVAAARWSQAGRARDGCVRQRPACRDSGGKIARARPRLRGRAGLRRTDGKPNHGHRDGGDQLIATAGRAAGALCRPHRGRRRGLLPVRRSLRDCLLRATWSGASEGGPQA